MPVPQKSTSHNRGVIGDIVASLWEPGVNYGLELLLHGVFLCLIISLVYILVLTGIGNIHGWLLLAITFLLYGTIFWYYDKA